MYKHVSKRSAKSTLCETLGVNRHSGSNASFDRASKWLSHCIDHDSGCRAPNPDFRPRRLIDVGSAGGRREPFLANTVESGSYACLSYCWGPDSYDVLKTLSHNLEAHRQAIPLLSLPASVRDAVLVCRGLGIRYLWVDSLCIVQDDKHDWLRESAQMRDIYLNSLVTIAAEEPASCKLGFLGEQNFGTAQWQRHFTTGDGDFFVRPQDPEAYLRSSKPSLDKRGWCLQESILPSRRLCFNGDEMAWECLARKMCECGHMLWAPPSSSQATPRKLPFRQPHQDWRALVEEYSDRSLTHKTDKLSAISGLAKMMAEATTANAAASYRAGLWMSEFVSNLTWRVEPLGESQGTDPWRAPSWSWASVDGSVRYGFDKVLSTWKYEPKQIMACKVEEVACDTLLPSDPTGSITEAYAILTAPAASVQLATLDVVLSAAWKKRNSRSYVSGSSYDAVSLVRTNNLASLRVFLDRPRDTSLGAQDSGSECWVEGRCKCTRCVWSPDRLDNIGEANQRVYCMKLFTWTASGGVDDSGERRKIPPETWFLVLRKVPAGEDVLERIGIGIWESRHGRRISGDEEECPLFIGCDDATVKII